MNTQIRHVSNCLLVVCGCLCLGLAACGENTPRKFAQGFRELRWHAPRTQLHGPARQPQPGAPLFPFDALVLVRDNDVSALGHIPVSRIAYAFTESGFQAVRLDFIPEYLLPVRKYFQDCYGQAQQTADGSRWEGYGVRIRLYPNAPPGPFALIEGPQL